MQCCFVVMISSVMGSLDGPSSIYTITPNFPTSRSDSRSVRYMYSIMTASTASSGRMMAPTLAGRSGFMSARRCGWRMFGI
jgi:hypothetical protein